MQPLRGPSEATGDRASSVHPHHPPSSAAPLTTAQRTTLERIIVKIMAISSLKSAELWAGIRHQANVKNDNELLSSHFPAAEHWLSEKLRQAQNSHSERVLLQQLTELLPAGNNRQAVSHYIRHQFGQTVLSSLTRAQLEQVLTMLKNGQMDIPAPQQSSATDRSLLPAEHRNLQQQVIKLTIAGGGTHATVWQNIFSLVSLKNGDPIPSRYYPLLTQYLTARLSLSTRSAPVTLHELLLSLKHPASEQENRYVEKYSAQQFQIPSDQPLSQAQAEALLNALFRYRAEALLPVREKPQEKEMKTENKSASQSRTARPRTPPLCWILVVVIIIFAVYTLL